MDLASAHVLNGELDEGCRQLASTFVELGRMGNERGLQQARRARQRLACWEREPAVRELDEQIRSLSLRR